MRCDGCDDEGSAEWQGCWICEACVITCNQWKNVQESRHRIEQKRLERCKAYVDGLSLAERGSTDRQLLNAVEDAMRLQEKLARKSER